MQAALMRLGLTEVASREITNNGIISINRLRALTDDDLDRLMKQIHRDNQGAGLFIPFTSQQYLRAIRFWANRMYIIGAPCDVNDINEPLAEMWNESMKAEREAVIAPSDLVKMPEPFKKDTKWRQWKESVITYLHSKNGQAGIPLAYITRENDLPTPGAVHATVHDQLVDAAILHGAEFNTNNGIVYDLLQSLTLNGPAWSWINAYQRTRDGRGAWKSLIAYYEGDAMQTRSKQECYEAILKATYQGNKRNFDFSSYVAIHQQAHQDLIRLGEPVPENKKVRDFLQGITDPQCSNIKLNVLSNPTFMNNFAQSINYMASAIDMITKNSGPSTRQIASLNVSGQNNSGRTGRNQHYQGRGRGRGGRNFARTGRGRGRGMRRGGRDLSFQGQQWNDHNAGDNRPITRGYSNEEWQNLTHSQRNRVYRERERIETARTVAAMIREDQQTVTDDVSAITTPPATGTTQVSQTGNGNASGNVRSIGQISTENASQAFSRRRINAYETINRSSTRYVASMNKQNSNGKIMTCRSELDSHADTCGVNEIARIMEYSGQVAEVSAFANSMQSLKNIPIVKAAVAYDDPQSGETIILVINQALYFGNHLANILLNPNQMRSNGIIVDDVPQHLSTSSTHSIIAKEDNVVIPLSLKGIISGFQVRTPTDKEIEECHHVILTSDNEWDPNSSQFNELETSHKRNHIQIAAFDLQCVEYSDCAIARLQEIENSEELHGIALTKTESKHHFFTPEELANKWAIGIVDAKRTVKATTQLFIRSALHPVERRFRTKNAMLRYNHLNCHFTSDTFFSSIKSINQNTCAQLFATDFGYIKCTPMRLKSEAGYALKELIQDVGIPARIHTDGAKELTMGTWRQVCKDTGIKTTNTEKDSPWQNKTEIEIRELKRHVRRLMSRTMTPLALWDYCCIYTTELRNRIVRPLSQQHGRTPYEILTGNTPDISEFLEFSWYQPIWYYDPSVFPNLNRHLGRWIGVAHRVGQAMCFWILPESGIPIARTTVQPVSKEELETQNVKLALQDFDQKISLKMENLTVDTIPTNILYREDTEDPTQNDEDCLMEPESTLPNVEDVEPDTYDQLLTTEPVIMKDGQMTKTRIIGRKRDNNNNLIGRYHDNPQLNTRIYLAEFPDGLIQELSANAVIEAIYSNIDEDGYDVQLFHDIVDHRKDRADVENHCQSQPVKTSPTTKGWEFCLEWKDGSTTWHSLRDVKNSFPIQLAEYAIRNDLQERPAFSWWVKHTLKKKTRIIKTIKSRYSQRSHKFGILVPKSVKEALEIDRATNTTFWRDAINKEMTNNRKAFQILEEDETVPIGYKWIRCHLIFDVKMDFTRKARFVAGGHMTNPPQSITYSSVVSRDSVRIAFLLAALNDVNILATDIGNAYLNALPREKVYTTAGPEFGAEFENRSVLIVRALYGLKSSGAAWRQHLANTLQHLGYKSCLADPDVWFRPARKEDGFQYYEYVLVYVDDLLVLSHQAERTMKALEEFYRLKDGYFTPTRYLGAEVKTWSFPEDSTKTVWAMTSVQYVKEAIRNIEIHLEQSDRKLFNSHQPFPSNYAPELDVTPYLDDSATNFYQSQVSILRWMVELGRLDIYIHVAMLSAFLTQPREGHLEAIYNVFGYLKTHNKSTMVFDDEYINWRNEDFPENDWVEFYPDARDEEPSNAPEPRGNPVQINVFVDASHARNKLSRRSHTGILIFLNKSPVIWYSKAQRTVETSTFGSEYIALKTGVEIIKSLQYKLRMVGVPIDGPANVLVDNETVMKNSTIPSSTLQKKHNSICYHYVREAVASKCIRIAYTPTEENLADMLTKPLGASKLKHFVQRILY